MGEESEMVQQPLEYTLHRRTVLEVIVPDEIAEEFIAYMVDQGLVDESGDVVASVRDLRELVLLQYDMPLHLRALVEQVRRELPDADEYLFLK